MAKYQRDKLPDASTALWAIPLKAGGVIEVHQLYNAHGIARFYSVIVGPDGKRTWRSSNRGWGTIEPAQNDARWVALQP